MTNEEIKAIFHHTYNVFWNKWRNVPLTRHDGRWDEVMNEYREIMKLHPGDLCLHIMIDLIEELQERCKEREMLE